MSRYSESDYRRYLAKALTRAREIDDCWLGRCRHHMGMDLDCIVFAGYPPARVVAALEKRGFIDSGNKPDRCGHSRMWFISYGVLFDSIEELRKAEKQGKL